MRVRTKATAIIAAGSLASLGFMGFGGTAWAGGTPTQCAQQADGSQPNSGTGGQQAGDSAPGGDCDITGTVTLSTALSLATNITAFNLNGAALNTPDGAGQVVISSNDSVGYYLSEAGPTGGYFTDTAEGTQLPESAVSASDLNSSGSYTENNADANDTPATNPGCPQNGGGTYSFTPLSATAFTLINVVPNGPGQSAVSGDLNCAAGFTGYTVPQYDDSFDLKGWELTTVNGAPGGTYTGNVQIALWGD